VESPTLATWGVTGAFRLWGSKLVDALRGNPATWPAWQGNPAFEASILLDNTSVTNIGIILGALIAAGLAGALGFNRRAPRNVVAAHTTGGIPMGYGAAIAFGWIWGPTALGDTWLGLRLRRVFVLSTRSPPTASADDRRSGWNDRQGDSTRSLGRSPLAQAMRAPTCSGW